MKNRLKVSSLLWLTISLFISTDSCKKDNETDSKNKYPVLTTTVVYDITQTTAKSGGTISSTGEDPIIEVGVCWDSLALPVFGNKTVDQLTDSTFTSNISKLSPGRLYFVRAYVKNKKGVFYAKPITFNSKKEVRLPTVSTYKISKIAHTIATFHGIITYDGDTSILEAGACWGTSNNPTVTDNKNIGKIDSISFTCQIHGLQPGKVYYARAYAINKIGISYGSNIKFTTVRYVPEIKFNQNRSYGEISDVEGNIYKTITIGTQVWIAENLRTTKLNDGTSLLTALGHNNWEMLQKPAYCWYGNDSVSYFSTYGALYNKYAVNTNKLCPLGWHVPKTYEWTNLSKFLGGDSISGGKLKETDTIHWMSPNIRADNSSGFSAIAAGFRTSISFASGTISTKFWSQSDGVFLTYKRYNLDFDNPYLINGASVRCIKD